jgi:hypothetical protein
MRKLLAQIALVPEDDRVGISPSNLTRVATALQKQVTRDFSPIWEVDGSVDAFMNLEDVPLGYWPIVLCQDIPELALGYHTDREGQPFALVRFTANWSLTASHECLEMLADPFGNRLIPSFSLREDQGPVSYLVEICDPCEGAPFAYTDPSNGVWVSDFYTPDFFDPQAASGVRYDFAGHIRQPRQVLDGGYISWHEPGTHEWWQLQYFDDQQRFVNLGQLEDERNLREAIDRRTKRRPEALGLPEENQSLRVARQAWSRVEPSSQSRAGALRDRIGRLKEQARQ